MMDRGQLFKNNFSVKPARNGSFVVYPRDVDDCIAFSNLADLMRFFSDEAQAVFNEKCAASVPVNEVPELDKWAKEVFERADSIEKERTAFSMEKHLEAMMVQQPTDFPCVQIVPTGAPEGVFVDGKPVDWDAATQTYKPRGPIAENEHVTVHGRVEDGLPESLTRKIPIDEATRQRFPELFQPEDKEGLRQQGAFKDYTPEK